jgi:hypothetical protein
MIRILPYCPVVLVLFITACSSSGPPREVSEPDGAGTTTQQQTMLTETEKGPVTTWRFVVANDRLYAIGSGSSYGTEGPIYTTDDFGDSWSRLDAPKATRDLAGDGRVLYALTSTCEVWSRAPGDKAWSHLRRGSGNGYLYSILVGKAGIICLTGIEEILLLDSRGKLIERLATPGRPPADLLSKTLFGRAFFADADEKQIVVEANPFTVFVVDLPNRTLVRWTDGMGSKSEGGVCGPCRVEHHGSGFLMNSHDGIYIAEGLLKPWRKVLSMGGDYESLLRGNFCRAFSSLDASTDRWLMADGAGIYAMQGSRQERKVWAEEEGDCHLVLDIQPFQGRYYVSFARLTGDTIGTVVPTNLSNVQTLHLTKQ